MINCSECIHSYVCVDAHRMKLMCCGGYQSRHNTVEVVRCKDCKHWHEGIGWCDQHSHYEEDEWNMFGADDFCSYGERRTNG